MDDDDTEEKGMEGEEDMDDEMKALCSKIKKLDENDKKLMRRFELETGVKNGSL